MIKPKSLAATALAVLFLAACGSTGGGMGDIFGGGNDNRNASNYELRGRVDHIDTSNRAVHLTNVSGYTSMLSNSGSGSGSSVRVFYDNQTVVQFQGQNYRVEDLERGDEVTVRVSEATNNTLIADSMTVTHDVSGGMTSGSGTNFPGSSMGSMLRGTVRNVDTSRGTIELDRGSGSNVMVEFGSNTPVYFNGRSYRVADLERGDEIEINVRDLGNNRFSASDITVTRSVSGGSGSGTGMGSSSSNLSTVRGTVVNVDTSRRTIELESATWSSNFNRGTTGGNRVVISYDNNIGVNVSGQTQPISGLERGDVIEVEVDNVNNAMRATRVWLVRDVRSF
jgi:hypothetical protein